MSHSFIESSINIQALPDKVWRVFTDPAITIGMGGEYVTDWKTGSSFRWKNSAGNILTNGMILQLETERLLQHNLYAPGSIETVSVITYRFIENDGTTTLHFREDLSSAISTTAYKEAIEGWNAALKAVKSLAEKL